MFMMPDHKIMPHIPVHGSLTDIPTSHHEREVSVKSYDGAVTKTPVSIKNIRVKLVVLNMQRESSGTLSLAIRQLQSRQT